MASKAIILDLNMLSTVGLIHQNLLQASGTFGDQNNTSGSSPAFFCEAKLTIWHSGPKCQKNLCDIHPVCATFAQYSCDNLQLVLVNSLALVCRKHSSSRSQMPKNTCADVVRWLYNIHARCQFSGSIWKLSLKLSQPNKILLLGRVYNWVGWLVPTGQKTPLAQPMKVEDG